MNKEIVTKEAIHECNIIKADIKCRSVDDLTLKHTITLLQLVGQLSVANNNK